MAKGEFLQPRDTGRESKKGPLSQKGPALREPLHGLSAPTEPRNPQEFIDLAGVKANAAGAVELYGILGSPARFEGSEGFDNRIDTSGTVAAAKRNLALLRGVEADAQTFAEIAEKFQELEQQADEALVAGASLYVPALEQVAADHADLQELQDLVAKTPTFQSALPSEEIIEKTERNARLLDKLPTVVPGFDEALYAPVKEKEIVRDIVAIEPSIASDSATQDASVTDAFIPAISGPVIEGEALPETAPDSSVLETLTDVTPTTGTELDRPTEGPSHVEAALTYFDTHPSATRKELMEHLGVKSDAIRKVMETLVEGGLIEQDGYRTTGKAGRPAPEFVRIAPQPVETDLPTSTSATTELEAITGTDIPAPTTTETDTPTEDFKPPLVRIDSETGVIHLGDADRTMITPHQINDDKVIAFISMIPDQDRLGFGLSTHQLARTLSATFDTNYDITDVHRIKGRTNQRLAEYGVRVEYDDVEKVYYRTLVEPKLPEVITEATSDSAPALDEAYGIDTSNEPTLGNLRPIDIASLAGVLRDPSIQAKFTAIEGLVDDEVLAGIEDTQALESLDRTDYTLSALQRVGTMISEDPAGYEMLVDETYASPENTNVGDLLLALGEIQKTTVGTNGDTMTGLEYVAFAIANPDADVATFATSEPDASPIKSAHAVDLIPGEAVTPITPEVTTYVPTLRPIERRDPNIRETLEGFYTEFGENPILSTNGLTSYGVKEGFSKLSKNTTDEFIQKGFVRPQYIDGKAVFTPAEVAAMLYLKVAPTERLAKSMKKDVVKIAQEVYDATGKQQILDIRQAQRDQTEK